MEKGKTLYREGQSSLQSVKSSVLRTVLTLETPCVKAK